MITNNSLSTNDSLQRLYQLQTKLQKKWFIFEEYYDLYYLTHLKLSKAMLFVGEKIVLFVDHKYEDAAKKAICFEVLPLDTWKDWLKNALIKRLHFDASKTSYERYLILKKEVDAQPAENPVKELRMVKSQMEIAAIKRSSELLMQGFLHLCKWLKEGITEKEVAQEFEIYCLKAGASRLAFEPIIAFGANSAMPHYRAGIGKLKQGDVVLIDVGVIVDDYASDMTRTLFFKKEHVQLDKIYDLVQEAYQAVIAHVRSGVSVQKLDTVWREYIQAHGNYPILHSIGHSLGLEVHEYPSVSIRAAQDLFLQEHMVITIEPGLYFPGVGGVRHENLLLIEEQGFKNFYNMLHVGKTIL
jgi:Xaa-Pro aminopeptidase